MSHIEKEKLIKADIASIENRVRHAFNQGYDLGYKEGKANCSEIPTGSTDCISRQAVIDLMMQKWGENFSGDDAMQESIDAIRVLPSVTPQEPILNKIFSIVHPLSIMSTPELEHKAIMQIAEMLEPLCLPESEEV